jgi:glyoxylase-like metal-dependent hydrolase (beta-lactamase superfamily II)
MPEIVPTLHWIKGRISNIYLWIGEDGLVLIDTGMSGDVDTILNYIEKIGRSPADLRAILITHADFDHAGGAAKIQARTGAAVFASKETADCLIAGKSPRSLGRLALLLERFFNYKPVPRAAIQQIVEGSPVPELEQWQLLATPGHTPDHYSFFNLTEGLLLTGDALNSRGGRLNCSPPRISVDMTAARQSARRLLRLAPAVFACGHGDPFIDFSASDTLLLDRQLA